MAWIHAHKGLAIALGLGVVVLLWLMLRGGGSSANTGGTSGLAAYYAAEGQSLAAGADVANSANALQASTNQTNASAQTAAGYFAAQEQLASTAAGVQTHAIDTQEAIDMAAIAAAKPTAQAVPVSGTDFFTEQQALDLVHSMNGTASYLQLNAVLSQLGKADAVRAADLTAKGIKVA